MFTICDCSKTNDDTDVQVAIDSLQKIQAHELNIWKFKVDSLNAEIDDYKKVIEEADSTIVTLNEDLVIAKYKLNRIEYYNKIAAKGNNIKFLRGWINRVLKDETE